jgi:hypothetical protein
LDRLAPLTPKSLELNDVKPGQGSEQMKTAMIAATLIASATFASADGTPNHFEVIETSSAGDQIEITTRQWGTDSASVYELSRVNCLPMMLGTVDQANQLDDLDDDGSANMEEVVRGTLRHDIAAYACSNG